MTEADEIVHEYDIFINPNPPGHLHCLSFPLRDKSDPINFDKVTNCELTQTSKRVTLSLDYSHAVEAAGFQHVLNEEHCHPDKSIARFAMFTRNREIHLSEITQTHQLRPTIGAQKVIPLTTSIKEEDTSGASRTNIIVPRAGAPGSHRRSSFLEEAGTEPRRRIVFPKNNGALSEELSKLFFAPPGTEVASYHVQNVIEGITAGHSAVKPPLRKAMEKYPLAEQIYEIMRNVQVLSLENVIRLVHPSALGCKEQSHCQALSQEVQASVFKALCECSVLTGDKWVCKAPKRQMSLKLRMIREFLLFQFYKAGDAGIRRTSLFEIMPKWYSHYIKKVLEDVSALDRDTRVWRLKAIEPEKAPTYEAFSIPETLVSTERLAWLHRESNIKRNLNAAVAGTPIDEKMLTMRWDRVETGATLDTTAPLTDRQSHAKEVTGLQLTSQQKADVKSYVRDLYSVHGVIHGSRIMPLIRQEKQKPTSKLRNLTEAQIFEALKPLLLMLNREKATAMRSWDYPDLDVYRNLVIKVLQSGHASRDTICRQVNQQTPSPMSDQTFRSIMNELGRYNTNENTWSFKTGMDM